MNTLNYGDNNITILSGDGSFVVPNIYTTEIVNLSQQKRGLLLESEQLNPKAKNYEILNPLCGDKVIWHIEEQQNKYFYMKYEVVGCLLCQASCALCYHLFYKQTLEKVNHSINKYELLAKKPEYNDEWQVFKPVLSTPSRLVCVSLGIKGLVQVNG